LVVSRLRQRETTLEDTLISQVTHSTLPSTFAPAKDIFVKLLMFFKTYLTFANNFDNAITTIGVCRQNKSFNSFLQCVRTSLFTSLLTRPVQHFSLVASPTTVCLLNTPIPKPIPQGMSQCAAVQAHVAG
jgi:hypothetical protein